jgi:hypothetical protein
MRDRRSSVGVIVGVVILGLAGLGIASELTLQWDAVPGAQQYTIERSTDGGQTWQPVGTTQETRLNTPLTEHQAVIFRGQFRTAQGQTQTSPVGLYFDGQIGRAHV